MALESSLAEARSEWIIESDDEEATDVVAHVVSRVGTAVRTVCDRYDGVKLHRGVAVFGAAHRSHLVSVSCGRDHASGSVALRVQVFGNRGAVRALVVFPAVMLLTLAGSMRGIGGPTGLLFGVFVGSVVAAAAAYATFALTNRTGAGRGKSSAVAAEVDARVREAVEAMGLTMHAAAVTLDGLDVGRTGAKDDAWDTAIARATADLAV